MEGRRMATQYCSTRQKARGLLAIGEWAGMKPFGPRKQREGGGNASGSNLPVGEGRDGADLPR